MFSKLMIHAHSHTPVDHTIVSCTSYLKVLDANGSSLVLAAEDEEDMTRWMQALCLATIGEEEVMVMDKPRVTITFILSMTGIY